MTIIRDNDDNICSKNKNMTKRDHRNASESKFFSHKDVSYFTVHVMMLIIRNIITLFYW